MFVLLHMDGNIYTTFCLVFFGAVEVFLQKWKFLQKWNERCIDDESMHSYCIVIHFLFHIIQIIIKSTLFDLLLLNQIIVVVLLMHH